MVPVQERSVIRGESRIRRGRLPKGGGGGREESIVSATRVPHHRVLLNGPIQRRVTKSANSKVGPTPQMVEMAGTTPS